MAQSHTHQQTQARTEPHHTPPRVHPPGRLAETEPDRSLSSRSAPATPREESLPREESQSGSQADDTARDTGSAPEPEEGRQGKEKATETSKEKLEQERFEKQLHHTRQRERRQLLEMCDRLLLLDFNTLAMPQWPDQFTVENARKQRDLWLFSLSVLSVLVLLGLVSLVPALVAGVSFGLGALLLALGLPPVRHLVTDRPSYAELLLQRQRLMRQARNHIRHLEGRLGLASCCRALGEYNPALSRPRFQRLYQLSQHGQLAHLMRTRGHCQLYLMFAMEAEKAYNRLQEVYLQAHQESIDAGEAEPLDAREKTVRTELQTPAQGHKDGGETGAAGLPAPGESTP